MHKTLAVGLGGTALAIGAVVGLPTAALADHCPDGEVHAGYSGECVPLPGEQPGGGGQQPGGGGQQPGGEQPGGEQPGGEQPGGEQPGEVGGGVTAPGTGGGGSAPGGGAATTGGAGPTTLPFTGDEILVLTIAGAGALAAGAAFVVAGRRRSAPTA